MADTTYALTISKDKVTEQANFNTNLKLVRIDYDKGIYTPGKVELLFEYPDTVTDADLKAHFNQTYKVTLEGNVIADGYRLFKIKKGSRQTIDSEGDIHTIKQVCFVLYSPDQLWTMKNGSYAWTGKTLGEILNDQVTKDGFTLKKETRTFLNYSEQIKDDKGNITIKTQELPQAYLVQYNEPFHDFVSRTANRCGEFLYWEDGKLNYGLPTPTTQTLKGALINQDFDCAESMSEEFQVVTLNNVSDDYSYTPITSFDGNHIPSPWGWWILKSAFESATQGDSLDTVVGKMVEETINDVVDCAMAGKSRDDEWKKYTKDEGDKSFSATTGIKNRYETGATAKTLMNAFYNKIRQIEKANTDEKVKLDFSGVMHAYKLGNRIRLSDSDNTADCYTITRISGYVDTQGGASATKKSHKAEAIKVLKYGDSTFAKASIDSDGKLSGEKITTFAVPPFDSRPCIRCAEPQEAVVKNNADPDYNGRVRVKFLWQGDAGGDSPWIRVSTPYSGKDKYGGFNMIPDKDAHVMLGFMFNNIEMPYVSGSVYINEGTSNRAPRGYTDAAGFTLKPDYQVQTISSSNGANLTFIDGSNDINFFNGIIPLVPQLWNVIGAAVESENKGEKGARKWGAGLNSDIRLRDRNGIVDLTMSSAGKKIKITSSFGNVEIDAYTGITISAPNGDVNIVGKNVNITAGNNLSLKSGANIRTKNEGESWASTFAGISGRVIAEVPKAFLREVVGSDISKLCDLSFLRVVTETILRPVEGTLSVSSNRNVAITAGTGKVRVPNSLIANTKSGWHGRQYNEIAADDEKKSEGFNYVVIAFLFKKIADIVAEVTATPNAVATFNYYGSKLSLKISSSYFTSLTENKETIWNYINFDKVQPTDENGLVKIVKEYTATEGDDDNIKYTPIGLKNLVQEAVPDENPDNSIDRANIVRANKVQKDCFDLAKVLVEDMNNALVKKAAFMKARSQQLDAAEPDLSNNAAFTQAIKGKIEAMLNEICNAGHGLVTDGICNNVDDSMPANEIKKKVIWNFIDQNEKIKKHFDWDKIKDNYWGKMEPPKPKEYAIGDFGMDVLASLENSLAGVEVDMDSGFYGAAKLVNYNGAAGPRAHWNMVSKGGILMSSDPGYTVQLKPDGSAWTGIQNPGIEIINTWMRDGTRPTELNAVLKQEAEERAKANQH